MVCMHIKFFFGTEMHLQTMFLLHILVLSRTSVLRPLLIIISSFLLFYSTGTGKSSVVCAICLGLAGPTRLLGRATEVCCVCKCLVLSTELIT